jgi:hypothetical protein
MRFMGAQTIVIEDLDSRSIEWPRLKAEFDAIDRRLGRASGAKAVKASFLSEAFEDRNGLKTASK